MSYSEIVRPIGPKPRACGCKGIRSCRLCTPPTDGTEHTLTPESSFIYQYCIHCKKAWHMDPVSSQQGSDSLNVNIESDKNCDVMNSHKNCTPIRSPYSDQDSVSGRISVGNGFRKQGEHMNSDFEVNDDVIKSRCSHENASHVIDFEGIMIIQEFVTEEEEDFLNTAITNCQFVNSQSGRRKQDYGPKVNFKKQKLRTANFTGLPSYSRFIYERMKTHPYLCDFEPVELCNLEYCQTRGAHIDAHFDDDWLWGERLVTLNLISDSNLTFTLDSDPGLAIKVPLLRRSLIVVSSAARYTWKHSILPEDIIEQRIAMTFRELSMEFTTGGIKEHEGGELLKIALSFKGNVVNS